MAPAPIAAAPVPAIHVDISGTAANDRIMGTTAADVIDGRGGADTMSGGMGNDTYVVDNAKDMVVEVNGGGIDTIRTSLGTYALGYQVENLTLTGTATQTGMGNELNNVLTANSVKSMLSGGSGNDTLVSVGGADTLTGGVGKDVFVFEKLPSVAATITDYVKGQDVLDLHKVLTNYHGSNPVADHWVQFQADAGGTTVYVDADGAGPGGFLAVAKLVGVTASLTAGSDWLF